MARKSNTAVAEAPEPQAEVPVAHPVNPPAPNGNGNGKAPPAMSYKLMVDQGTSLEAAVWPKELNGQNGSYTVYSVTFRRSYRDDQGTWQNPDKAFFRPHELP